MAEKNKVIKFFQNLPEEKSEQFNEAFALYRGSAGANQNTIRSVNVQGYNARNLDNLLYDLQKLHGITDVEKIPSGSKGSKKAKESKLKDAFVVTGTLTVEQKEEIIEALEALTDTDAEPEYKYLFTDEAIDVNWKEYFELQNAEQDLDDSFLKSFAEHLIVKFESSLAASPEDLNNINVEAEQAALLTENQEAKTDITLREEFPFLNDPDCPNELKILVADKMTAYAKYKKGVEFLKQIEDGSATATDAEVSALAKEVTEAFEENQEIYKELNVFKETGVLLGEHPLFTKLALTREVEAMTSEEKIKFKQSSVKYFSDNKSKLATAQKAKDDKAIEKIEKRVAERSEKLFLVNKALGV